jgi:hypothetical protein
MSSEDETNEFSAPQVDNTEHKATGGGNEGDDFLFFIAVHTGAGFHSEENAPSYHYLILFVYSSLICKKNIIKIIIPKWEN